MATVNTVKIKCAFDNTNFTRVYEFDNIASSQLASVKSGIQPVNERLAAARDNSSQNTADYYLRATFISDDFDNSQSPAIGYLHAITEAEIIQTEETKIPLF